MNTILLIEDHETLRRNLEQMLVLEGYRVVTATDGPTGLQAARECAPAVVVCDIMLPGMDGLELLARLRAHDTTRELPFIFLTAKGEPADIRNGMNLGADDYLPKPVARADLLASIETRLRRAASGRRTGPDFSSAVPLESLGLTPREAEVLLWLAQGKANHDIATIIGCTHATVKKHSGHIFEKLQVETRGAAMLIAIEKLSRIEKPSPSG